MRGRHCNRGEPLGYCYDSNSYENEQASIAKRQNQPKFCTAAIASLASNCVPNTPSRYWIATDWTCIFSKIARGFYRASVAFQPRSFVGIGFLHEFPVHCRGSTEFLKSLADIESNSPMGFLATIGTAKLLFVRMALRERIRNILPHGRKRSTAQFQIVQLLGQSIAAVLLTKGTARTHPQCDHDGIWNRKISD